MELWHGVLKKDMVQYRVESLQHEKLLLGFGDRGLELQAVLVARLGRLEEGLVIAPAALEVVELGLLVGDLGAEFCDLRQRR